MEFTKKLLCYFVVVTFCLITNPANCLKQRNSICVQISSCECAFPSGVGINLHGLGKENVESWFYNTQPITVIDIRNVSDYDAYIGVFFHPCSDKEMNSVFGNVTTSNDCQLGSSLCLATKRQMTNVGTTNDVHFVSDVRNQKIQMVYEHNNWVSTINLVCEENKNTTLNLTEYDSTNKKLKLDLHSKYSCFTEDLGEPQLTTLQICILILAVLLILYFIGGYLIRRYIFGYEHSEAFPHHEFFDSIWTAVKEIISCCSSCCYPRSGYDRI